MYFNSKPITLERWRWYGCLQGAYRVVEVVRVRVPTGCLQGGGDGAGAGAGAGAYRVVEMVRVRCLQCGGDGTSAVPTGWWRCCVKHPGAPARRRICTP